MFTIYKWAIYTMAMLVITASSLHIPIHPFHPPFRHPVGPVGNCGGARSRPWYQWIGFLGKIYRKPCFLPSNIGLSCKFSHHPILWWYQFSPPWRIQYLWWRKDRKTPWDLTKMSDELWFNFSGLEKNTSRSHIDQNIYVHTIDRITIIDMVP